MNPEWVLVVLAVFGLPAIYYGTRYYRKAYLKMSDKPADDKKINIEQTMQNSPNSQQIGYVGQVVVNSKTAITITPQQQQTLIASFKQFAGNSIDVFLNSTPADLAAAGRILASALTTAGVITRVIPGQIFSENPPPSGLSINAGKTKFPAAEALAKCLIESGIVSGQVPGRYTNLVDELTIVVSA